MTLKQKWKLLRETAKVIISLNDDQIRFRSLEVSYSIQLLTTSSEPSEWTVALFGKHSTFLTSNGAC